MEERFSCVVYKYDSGEEYKEDAVIMLGFEFEIEMFRSFVKRLIGSNIAFFPLTSVDFIDNKFRKFPGIYYGALTNQVTVEFVDRYNFVIHFQNGFIKGWMSEEDLVKWGVQGASDFFEENMSKKLVLTNNWNTNQHDNLTETYIMSFKKTIESNT